MLRLLGKIRQKLIREGKLGNYLVYALGEFILIVLGIFIALQVNDWYQKSQNEEIERQLIASLHNEFKQNKKVFLGVREQMQRGKESCYQLMDLMKKDPAYLSNYDLNYLIYTAIDRYHFSPSNNVLSEVLQSGKLGLLTDERLKSSFYEWDRLLEEIDTSFDIYTRFMDEQVVPYLFDNIAMKNLDVKNGPIRWDNFSEFEDGKMQIFQDRKFENLVGNLVYYILMREEDFDAIENTIDNILRSTKP